MASKKRPTSGDRGRRSGSPRCENGRYWRRGCRRVRSSAWDVHHTNDQDEMTCSHFGPTGASTVTTYPYLERSSRPRSGTSAADNTPVGQRREKSAAFRGGAHGVYEIPSREV